MLEFRANSNLNNEEIAEHSSIIENLAKDLALLILPLIESKSTWALKSDIAISGVIGG